jgi:hypothetical protein
MRLPGGGNDAFLRIPLVSVTSMLELFGAVLAKAPGFFRFCSFRPRARVKREACNPGRDQIGLSPLNRAKTEVCCPLNRTTS